MSPELQVLGTVCGWSVLLVMWLMGRKTIWGPISGVTFQILWCVYGLLSGQWGLLAASTALGGVHIWNWIKWKRQEKNHAKIRNFVTRAVPIINEHTRRLSLHPHSCGRYRGSDRGTGGSEPVDQDSPAGAPEGDTPQPVVHLEEQGGRQTKEWYEFWAAHPPNTSRKPKSRKLACYNCKRVEGTIFWHGYYRCKRCVERQERAREILRRRAK